jgi:putative Holliday junction resolvase
MAAVLGLDIGERRIGVALADDRVRLASPLKTVINDEHVYSTLQELCLEHTVLTLVAGLPRGLDGQETAQTNYARTTAKNLADQLQLPLYLIDEAVTSKQAKAELEARRKPYTKGDIDALAATYILEDYLALPPNTINET